MTYAVFALEQHRTLQTASYDSVIFDQAIRGYAGFGAPLAPVKGVHNGFGPHFSVLGDHFSPILAVLAPVYWLAASPVSLLLAQAFLIAVSVVPVWLFTRRALGMRAAYLVGAAYLLAWGFQSALAIDFHEVAFAVPLLALAIERLHADRPGQAAAAAATLLLVKEDLGLVVAVFGLLLALRGARRLGLLLGLGGLLAVVVTTQVLIPAAGGRSDYYWTYTALGPDPLSALGHVVRHPLASARLLVSPAAKWHTLLWLLAPLGFLPLLSPIALLAVPQLLERFLSTNAHYWTTGHHYNAPLVPVLTLAAVDGLSRLRPHLHGAPARRAAALLPAAFLAVAVVSCAFFPFRRLATAAEWTSSPRLDAAYAAVAAVPDGVTVEADNRLGPHLTGRAHVLLLDRTPRGAPWVVVDVARHEFPFADLREQQQRVRTLTGRGYLVTFDRDGYVVLHRP